MPTYSVPVRFNEVPSAEDCLEIVGELGDYARTIRSFPEFVEGAFSGENPVTFFVVIDDVGAVDVGTPEPTEEDAARVVVTRALLDARYTVDSAKIDTENITRVD